MKLHSFAIYAKNPDRGQEVKSYVEARGFEYSEENPDVLITVGGDGTYLEAERKFPGIPKLLVRDSLICFKCHNEPLDQMLEMLQAGKGRVEELIKLEAIYKTDRLVAVNDIILRNENPTRALRFKVILNSQPLAGNIIGDGVVVATPFGATGYYRSVTRSTFNEGIGLAFNNSTEEKAPLLLDENTELTIEIVRGKGELAADNDPKILVVDEGDRLFIRKASQVGRLIFHNLGN